MVRLFFGLFGLQVGIQCRYVVIDDPKYFNIEQQHDDKGGKEDNEVRIDNPIGCLFGNGVWKENQAEAVIGRNVLVRNEENQDHCKGSKDNDGNRFDEVSPGLPPMISLIQNLAIAINRECNQQIKLKLTQHKVIAQHEVTNEGVGEEHLFSGHDVKGNGSQATRQVYHRQTHGVPVGDVDLESGVSEEDVDDKAVAGDDDEG